MYVYGKEKDSVFKDVVSYVAELAQVCVNVCMYVCVWQREGSSFRERGVVCG